MSQPAADLDPFATAPEPEPEPAQPLASLIRCYFGPKPSFYYQEEEDAYYQSLDELHEEITERLAGKEGRIMDAAPRLRDLATEVSRLSEGGVLPDGDVVNVPTLLWAERWNERLQYLLADLS